MTTFDSAAPGVIGDYERSLKAPKAKKALIIVDVQNDFIEGGSLGVDGGEEVAQRIANLLRDVQGSDDHKVWDLVVSTQDWHISPGYEDVDGRTDNLTLDRDQAPHWSAHPDFKNTWPIHGEAGTEGAELSPRLTPVLDKIDRRFYKGQRAAAYSGFEALDGKTNGDAGLGEYLKQAGITEVDIVGIATDYCVKATALDAVKEGFVTRVILPFTAAVAPESNIAARKEMAEAGVILAEGGSVL